MSKQVCYFFDDLSSIEDIPGGCIQSGRTPNILGEKGRRLVALHTKGITNIPEGFILTTDSADHSEPFAPWNEIQEKVQHIEEKTGLKFDDEEKPLLFSVRTSYPNKEFPAILNVGLNDHSTNTLANLSGNPKFAWDLYKNYIEFYATTILGKDIHEQFEEKTKQLIEEKGYQGENELLPEDIEQLVGQYKELLGDNFPQDPMEQLKQVILYAHNKLDPHANALLITRMVFGNMGEHSGSGYASTRSPETGEQKFTGKFLINGQGNELGEHGDSFDKFEEAMPEAFAKFQEIAQNLEKQYKDIVQIYFTVENNELFIFDVKVPERDPLANIKIAYDLCTEEIITKEEAVSRIKPSEIEEIFKESFDAGELEGATRFVTGKCNAPGQGSGNVYFDIERAKAAVKEGEDVIIWRPTFKPEDAPGISLAKGIFATEDCDIEACRKLGIPAIVACEGLEYDKEEGALRSGDTEIHEGDPLSIDGELSAVLMDKIQLTSANIDDQESLLELLKWADDIAAKPNQRHPVNNGPTRGLQIMATVDNADDADKARSYGAVGIGLLDLNSMILGERAELVRRILTVTEEEEKDGAVQELEEGISGDLAGIFEAMAGLPIKIRLLNANLAEFFPDVLELADEVFTMKQKGKLEGDLDEEEFKEKRDLYKKVQSLQEINPRLGNKGSRLLIMYQELLELQIRAIVNAACTAKEGENEPFAEVMIPLPCSENELIQIKPIYEKIVDEVLKEREITKITFKYGASIEAPRAALISDKMAQYSDFLTYDIDNLTQLSFGLSKEDAERTYLPMYRIHGIVKENPFTKLDKGVEKMLKMASEKARRGKHDIIIGISGEQSGDANTVRFCHSVGMNFVSCEPNHKMLIARLVAAQCVLEERE